MFSGERGGRISRRAVLAGAATSLAAVIGRKAFAAAAERPFRLWVMSDPHVGSDLRRGRESLADAIEQSESGGGFSWDVALCLGDFSGAQGVPDEKEGREVVRQFAALKKHRREQIYCLAGNHDASIGNRWFRRWIDPTGEHTATSGVDARRRPYPIEGTWQRYSFRVGNLVFAMMSDRNDYAPPVGRIREGKGLGGRPPGAVTTDAFAWWRRLVEDNADAIVVSAHHHMLKETTAASGPWEGFRRDEKTGRWRGHIHGYFPEDGEHNQGAGWLYWLVDEHQSPIDARGDAQAFERYLAERPGAIDLWLGGHSHLMPGWKIGGRTHVERKWDATFVNCAALTRHHGGRAPMSRLLSFTPGSDRLRVQCYLHTAEVAPQGWLEKEERVVQLSRPFEWSL